MYRLSTVITPLNMVVPIVYYYVITLVYIYIYIYRTACIFLMWTIYLIML
jgi:hypothetical protein